MREGEPPASPLLLLATPPLTRTGEPPAPALLQLLLLLLTMLPPMPWLAPEGGLPPRSADLPPVNPLSPLPPIAPVA